MGIDKLKIILIIFLFVLFVSLVLIFSQQVVSFAVKNVTKVTMEPNLTQYVNKNVTDDEVRFMSYLSKVTKNKTKK